jgi:hypothetical protein
MLSDLYFTHIRINSIPRNALVCKSWYLHLKFKLREKKIKYYDTKIYEIVINNVYSFDILNAKYYDELLRQLMTAIINDDKIKHIIKKNMIEYHNTFAALYHKYNSNIELLIADEYKKLIDYYS